MYKLYYRKGACSLGIHALANFLEAKLELIDASKMDNFKSINPTGTVPFLMDGSTRVQEGAAIAMYLMEKHNSPMLPTSNFAQRTENIQWLMFANATVHPAYSKLFFIMKNIQDPKAKEDAFAAAYNGLNSLWKIADEKLAKTKFIAGDEMSMADIFLTVYAGWNAFFQNKITLGDNVTRMVKEVSSKPAFKKALEEENHTFAI